MQNKPNFRNDKMNTTLDRTGIYMILSADSGQKTKPIQTQFKANLSQNKPNSKPIKPKTNPIQTQLLQRTKLMHRVYIPTIKNKNADRSYEKTNNLTYFGG
ncbi:MAG: hypothetical protein H8D56_19935 [Planctomycetes bacterium]|nr:hypothetical protein [Planctomycetota bacterium]